jgi:hypothetical protein
MQMTCLCSPRATGTSGRWACTAPTSCP